MSETTDPLRNGDDLPTHPSSTTALKITKYGNVYDDGDGTPLRAGVLRESEIQMLMDGNQMALRHLYLYAVRDKKIYHTRDLVSIEVECEPDGDV